MSILTLYWVGFTLLAFGALYIAIPYQRIQQLFPFGFWSGFFLAVVFNWLGMNMFGFSMPGDIALFGIPFFSSLYFLPLAIGFAHYYPLKNKDRLIKIDYVLLFAAITTFLQSLLAIFGMWKGAYGWNVAYTFILAVIMHTIMTVYFLSVEVKQTA